MMRVGIGFDVHRLEPGRPCILGGIELPHATGPAGHSDGDAVLHAVIDALRPLGAEVCEIPVTPRRVLRAIVEAAGNREDGTGGRPT